MDNSFREFHDGDGWKPVDNELEERVYFYQQYLKDRMSVMPGVREGFDDVFHHDCNVKPYDDEAFSFFSDDDVNI